MSPVLPLAWAGLADGMKEIPGKLSKVSTIPGNLVSDRTLMTSYKTEFSRSIEQPESFWAEQARRIPWFRPPTTILSYDEQQHARWFVDGELNICHAALDHHVDHGRGEQPAILWDSPVTQSKRTLTYREMRDQVALFAGALKNLGVEKGDRVVIYMPMV
jgi:propionyl-CoA synthetase